MKGVAGAEERLAHILNIKQANCKEETFLPLEGKRTSSLPSILILPSCPPAIRHTLSEASQQLQPCLKSSNRVPTSDIIINGRKKPFPNTSCLWHSQVPCIGDKKKSAFLFTSRGSSRLIWKPILWWDNRRCWIAGFLCVTPFRDRGSSIQRDHWCSSIPPKNRRLFNPPA